MRATGIDRAPLFQELTCHCGVVDNYNRLLQNAKVEDVA
jgi:hypothetical protein